jgi:hypothetical protein
MSEGIPEFLAQGEVARLIPICAASQRERAACSVLLAALRVVHPFARDLLSELGKRVGNWASVEAYTEVVFKDQPDGTCRPAELARLEALYTENLQQAHNMEVQQRQAAVAAYQNWASRQQLIESMNRSRTTNCRYIGNSIHCTTF